MKSRRTESFEKLHRRLSDEIQARSKEAYDLWCRDPNHPGLNFKKLHGTKANIWSARITRNVRAICVIEKDTAIWFWIGNHDAYERLLQKL